MTYSAHSWKWCDILTHKRCVNEHHLPGMAMQIWSVYVATLYSMPKFDTIDWIEWNGEYTQNMPKLLSSKFQTRCIHKHTRTHRCSLIITTSMIWYESCKSSVKHFGFVARFHYLDCNILLSAITGAQPRRYSLSLSLLAWIACGQPWHCLNRWNAFHYRLIQMNECTYPDMHII